MLRQRQPRLRDPGFLAFVRRQPCCRCGASPSEAAHLRMGSRARDKRPTGMSEKPDDRWANPLCAGCHRNDPGAQHRVGEVAFWPRVGIDPFEHASALWRLYHSTRGVPVPAPLVVAPGGVLVMGHSRLATVRKVALKKPRRTKWPRARTRPPPNRKHKWPSGRKMNSRNTLRKRQP